MRKKISICVAIGMMIGVSVWLLFNSKNASTSGAHSSMPAWTSSSALNRSSNVPPASFHPATGSGVSAASQNPASQAAANQDAGGSSAETNLPPEIVLQNVRRAVHQYGDMFGGNPVGTNPEITAALAGKNPKQINFLNGHAGMRVNQNGELIDTWGTPYFFHQLSGHDMEIHSAGPDKIMWTSDDLVTR